MRISDAEQRRAEAPADEADWIDQSLRGDKAAFAPLMHRYTGAVFNVAYRMLGNAQDAEDAVQEIFLRAYARLSSFDQSRRFSTWLLTIASNYCVDRLRRRRFAWMTLDDVAYAVPTTRPGPERRALQREQQAAVQEALQLVPEQYRLVLILRYWNDLSYEEIMQVTGLSESTLKTRLHRARHMLAQRLGPEGRALWEDETTSS